MRILILLTALLLPAFALAEDAADRAATLAESANKLARAGEYKPALDLFEQAYALSPEPVLLYNIGRVAEKLEDWKKAAGALRAFLEVEKDPAKRAKAQGVLDNCQAHLPAYLTVSCPVSGAVVEVDGKPAGRVPLQAPIEVAPGKHAVKVLAPAKKPFEQSVEVKGTESVHLSALLEDGLVPNERSDGNIASLSPENTAALTEDALHGYTTSDTDRSSSLDVGSRSAAIPTGMEGISVKDNIDAAKATASASKVQTPSAAEPLDPCHKMLPNNGCLSVSATPTGAEVYIDDFPVGLAPVKVATLAGNHRVRVHMEGFIDAVATLDLPVGAIVGKSYKLVEFGRVSVDSRPSGAFVLIDGKRMGKTPLIAPALGEGKYEIELRLDNYITHRMSVNIHYGEKRDVIVDLLPVDVARREYKVKSIYANVGLGIAIGGAIATIVMGILTGLKGADVGNARAAYSDATTDQAILSTKEHMQRLESQWFRYKIGVGVSGGIALAAVTFSVYEFLSRRTDGSASAMPQIRVGKTVGLEFAW